MEARFGASIDLFAFCSTRTVGTTKTNIARATRIATLFLICCFHNISFIVIDLLTTQN